MIPLPGQCTSQRDPSFPLRILNSDGAWAILHLPLAGCLGVEGKFRIDRDQVLLEPFYGFADDLSGIAATGAFR
jgi:hypothetical protein